MKKGTTNTNPVLDAAVKASKETKANKTTKKAKDVAAAVTSDKVAAKRETDYKFPEGCTSLKDKKAFRSMVRRKTKAFLTKLAKYQASELAEDKEMFEKTAGEYEAFIKEHKVSDPILETDTPKPAKKAKAPKTEKVELTPEDEIGTKKKVTKPAKNQDPDAKLKTIKRKSKANKQ